MFYTFQSLSDILLLFQSCELIAFPIMTLWLKFDRFYQIAPCLAFPIASCRCVKIDFDILKDLLVLRFLKVKTEILKNYPPVRLSSGIVWVNTTAVINGNELVVLGKILQICCLQHRPMRDETMDGRDINLFWTDSLHCKMKA